MLGKLLVEALLIAARRHRLVDRPVEERLRTALSEVTPATPQELDACLRGTAILSGDSLTRVRKLLPDPTRWDDYQPHRPLAHLATGGMGDIWLARDAQNGDLAVIKTMRADLLGPVHAVEIEDDGTVWLDTGSGGMGGEASPGSAMQRRIERESRITRQLQHPNIVRCRDHGLTRSGNLFMVLDYHGSGDLFGLITAQGRLSETLALSLIEQVAAALEASHRLTLVHRDIKAGNIFLTADGGAKLADFGFARSTRANRTQLTMAGSVIGSPSCMAPEQIEGRTDLDIRADLYAVGCVLFQAIVGTPPFTGTVQEMMRGHCAVVPPTLTTVRSDVSALTSAIVERCLRKDREQRYSTPAELRRDVQAALTALGVPNGTRVPLPPPPSTGSSRLPSQQPSNEAAAAPAQASPPAPVAPVSPPAPAVANPPVSSNASAASLGDWLMLSDHDTTIALFARPRLTLGKLMGASVDICLRNYPEDQHREECMRISRQHLLISSDAAGGFQIQDLSSANGTLMDGEALVGGKTVAISSGIDHLIELAQVISLRLRAIPSQGSSGCSALVLARPKNRPGLAYALVREVVSLGGPGADVMLPGCPQGVAAWIAWSGGQWTWRPDANTSWMPINVGSVITGGNRSWTARAGNVESGF